MITSLPNLLTISRVAAIPVMIVMLFLEGDLARYIACTIFSIAGFTDMLDGWAARMMREESAFGRFLDPIADKLLVASALMMLVAESHISGLVVIPALIILCREILVSGLREFLAGLQVSLPVSGLAKWKTGIQMVAIGVLIVGDAGPDWLPTRLIGEIGLWTAAALTLITGWDYLRASARYVAPSDPPRSKAEPPAARTP